MKKLLLASVYMLAASWSVGAADLAVRPRDVAPVPDFGACTQAMCTGPYLDFHIAGNGSNADILGSGLNGSIFNNGVGLGVAAGYQFWNGNILLGAELGGTYYAGSNSDLNSVIAAVGGTPKTYNWSVDFVGIAGYGLNGMFNAPPAGGAGPITPIQALNGALVTPFFEVGGRLRDGLSGFLAGAGMEYTLGGHSAIKVDYRHINYDKGTDAGGLPIHIGSEQEVRAAYVYKF